MAVTSAVIGRCFVTAGIPAGITVSLRMGCEIVTDLVGCGIVDDAPYPVGHFVCQAVALSVLCFRLS